MRKTKRLALVFLSILLGQQAFALSCVAPPEQPFETAKAVFLAQVTKSNKNFFKKRSITAPINIIKVYKGSIEDIKDAEKIYSADWLGRPHLLIKGKLFLLFDHASIGNCIFTNGQIAPELLEVFEKEHPPIWVRPEKHHEVF